MKKQLILAGVTTLSALALSTSALAAGDASVTFTWKGPIPTADTESGARIVNKGTHDFNDGLMTFSAHNSTDVRSYELAWAETFLYSVEKIDTSGTTPVYTDVQYDSGIETAYLTTVVEGGGLRPLNLSGGYTCDPSLNDICVMADSKRMQSGYTPDVGGTTPQFLKTAGTVTALTLETPDATPVPIFALSVDEADIPNAWVTVQASVYVDADI